MRSISRAASVSTFGAFLTLTETSGAKVFDSASGGEISASLLQKKTYNLALRQQAESDPYRTAGAAAETRMTLDGLGRTITTERRSASGASFTKATAAS